jgi:hypothetical protein
VKIDQSDLAHLSDDDIRRLVLAIVASIEDGGHPGLSDFYSRLVVALVRTFRARRASFIEQALELMNDDGPGMLVEPGCDPVADALEEMRRAAGGFGS